MDHSSLSQFWAALIAFALFVYIIRDGYDLGIGILFGFARDRGFRDTMVKAISPFWDGNEVWLILVGAGLFSAFPLVYAIVLPALYLPLAVMLIALTFRGVSIEFRYHGAKNRLWDRGFFAGSLITAFVQGVAAGGLIQGLPVTAGGYAGGSWEWLTPFSLLCGAALTSGYTLLGAAWLVLKTEGPLRDWAYRRLPGLLAGTLTAFALASLATFAVQPRILERWLDTGWLFLLPLLALSASIGLWIGIKRRWDGIPYAMAGALFLTAFLAFTGSFWPYLIPYTITLDAAAAPIQTLEFLFYGAGIAVFPLVLICTGAVSWMLRGKV
jgi:cytochrome d ubiquinol oxidase subunit II